MNLGAFENGIRNGFDGGEILVDWCVIATVIDNDGSQKIATASNDSLVSSQLGMLRTAVIEVEEQLRKRFREDD